MSTPVEEREFWDEQAQINAELAIWAEPFDDEAWHTGVDPCLEAIVPHLHIEPGGEVLEIGCGIGRLTVPLAERNPETMFHGVDISPEMISRAPEVDNIVWHIVDGRTLPFWDLSFDAAYTMITFQHIPAEGVKRYIEEVYRCLRFDGVFRFQYVEGDCDTFLQHDLKQEDVVAWCHDAGFSVESVESILHEDNASFSPTWRWVTAVKP